MSDKDFIKYFWNKKILKWEDEKYSNRGFIFDVNSSVKYRMFLAKNILSKIAKNKTIMEIGCGSGMLINNLDRLGVKKYIGIDISNEAIKKAKLNVANLKNIEVTFLRSDINEIRPQKVDVCFSLGLLDWISIQEINKINKTIDANIFFHSFSEKRFSFYQMVHSAYVFTKYGYKTNGYKPFYYKSKDIYSCFKNGSSNISFYRNKKLSFGTLVHNLPINLIEEIN